MASNYELMPARPPVFRTGFGALKPRLRENAEHRLLDVTEWFGDTTGGIRTYLMEKARYVSAHPEWSHAIVVPGADDSIEDVDGTRIYRLHGPRIPGQAPYRLLLSRRKLNSIATLESPTIVETGSPFISAWIAKSVVRKLGVPVVSYYHANVPALFRSAAAQRGAQRYLRTLHESYALTIAASKYAVGELLKAGIDRVEHVPLGVDVDCFNTTRRAFREQVRERAQLPQDVVLAGFAGRFASEKELLMVLDAWEGIEKATGAQLVLAGAGPLHSQLRSHSYGKRVHFLPFIHSRTEMADFLASLDLYLAPGRIETFGLSSLEALSCGTPVVGANSGGVAEQIVQSGGGVIFEAGVQESFASAVKSIVGNSESTTLGARGREYAVSRHSWDTVMEQLFSLYAKLSVSEVAV